MEHKPHYVIPDTQTTYHVNQLYRDNRDCYQGNIFGIMYWTVISFFPEKYFEKSIYPFYKFLILIEYLLQFV